MMMMVIPTMIIILSILIKMIDLQAARNLMEAVVLTVKASYVASRMFNNHKQVDFSTKQQLHMLREFVNRPKVHTQHAHRSERSTSKWWSRPQLTSSLLPSHDRREVLIRHVHRRRWLFGRWELLRSSLWCAGSLLKRWEKWRYWGDKNFKSKLPIFITTYHKVRAFAVVDICYGHV